MPLSILYIGAFMRNIILSVILIFVFSCSCDNIGDDSPYLAKDYNYITCILVPDSFRTYRQEVFVGKMLDKRVSSDKIDTTHYGEDEQLYTQNLVTVLDYRGKLEGTQGAIVKIKDQEDNEVFFQDVGNGIYRDVNNLLKVKPLFKYKLYVTIKNSTFYAETTVPGNFQITNINQNDTLTVKANIDDYLYWAEYRPSWSNSSEHFFYRTNHGSSNFSFTVINHVYEPPGFFLVNADTLHHTLPLLYSGWFEAFAFDSNYGKMYSSENTCTAPIPLLTYLSNQETTPLPKRTNLQGKDVVGVFGSFNRTKLVNFYMKVIQ